MGRSHAGLQFAKACNSVGEEPNVAALRGQGHVRLFFLGVCHQKSIRPKRDLHFAWRLEPFERKCSYGDALDVTWAGLQAKDGWYTMPNAARKGSILGYQAASFSDIERSHTDYGVR